MIVRISYLNDSLWFRHRFDEDHAIHLYCQMIKNILQIQSIVSMIKTSKTSFEQKFYDNIMKSIDEILQLDMNF